MKKLRPRKERDLTGCHSKRASAEFFHGTAPAQVTLRFYLVHPSQEDPLPTPDAKALRAKVLPKPDAKAPRAKVLPLFC